jgi:peptidoglycan/LPS O-acetylase OafA/YrhL
LYLLHHFGLGIAERFEQSTGLSFPFGRFVLGGACAFALAELSYRYYEARFLELKARYSHAGGAATRPATA